MSKFSKILRISLSFCLSLVVLLSSNKAISAIPKTPNSAPNQQIQNKNFRLRIEHIEKEEEKRKKYIELILTESIKEDLLLNGDKINFKIPKTLTEELEIPENSYLETQLHFDPNLLVEQDKNAYLELKNIHSANGQSINCTGKLRFDLSKHSQKLETKIANNQTLKTVSNIVAGSIVASVDSLEYGGLPLMMLSNGFSVLAAASIGAAKGLFDSSKETKIISHIPSDTNMKLRVIEDLKITNRLYPKSITETAINAEEVGIKLTIEECEKIHSYNFGESLALNLVIENFSGIDFDISDLVLVNQNTAEEFLLNPLLSEFNQNNFEIKGNSKKNLKLIYSLGSMAEISAYQLRIIDPLNIAKSIYFPINID